MDVKGEVLLQLLNKSKLRNVTKKFLEPKFLFIVKFKKFGFSTPLMLIHFYFNHKSLIAYIRGRPLRTSAQNWEN